MKNIFIMSIMIIGMLTGCKWQSYDDKVKASAEEPNVDASSHANEVCYENVVYVKFSLGSASWGSVKVDKDSKVVTCD